MKKETVIIGGILLFLFWKYKNTFLPTKKKVKATITPLPLENITAKQYQDALNTSTLPVGIVQTSNLMQDAMNLPITQEIKKCCCNG